jgi:SNF2 family DNA or RNA helicase
MVLKNLKTLEDIQKLMGWKIYSQSLEFSQNDSILKYDQKPNLISARVQDNGTSTHRTEISITAEGAITKFRCTCHHGRFCKHIGAVLIHTLQHKSLSDLSAQITKVHSKNKPPEDEIINFDFTDYGDYENDFIHKIEDTSSFSLAKNKGKRYKLVFLVEKSEDYYYSTEHDPAYWIISPGTINVKEDETFGKIELFEENKVSEEVTEVENSLARLLLENEDADEALCKYLDLIINNPNLPVYIKFEQNYLPLKRHSIESTTLGFNITGIEESVIFFTPEIRVFYGNAISIISYDNEKNIIRNGFSFYYLDSKGLLLYKKDSMLYTSFFYHLIESRDEFLLADIAFFRNFVEKQLKDCVHVDFSAKSLRISSHNPKPLIEISPSSRKQGISIVFNYNGHEFAFKDKKRFLITSSENSEMAAIYRNRKYEDMIKDYVEMELSNLPDRKFVKLYDSVYINFEIGISLEDFLSMYGSVFIDKGIDIRLKGSKKKITSKKGEVCLNISSNADWFDVKLNYRDEEGKEKPVNIDSQYLDKGLLKVGGSFILLTKKDIEKIKKLQTEGLKNDGSLKVSKLDFNLIDEIYNDIANKTKEITSIVEVAEKLKDFKEIKKHALPKNFKGKLRGYQISGYNWLNFLREYGFNGCLADDMGLGKTVQTLALLQKVKENNDLGTSLLIVPVSTIPNWENEIERFTPLLKHIRHSGIERNKDLDYLNKFDLIIMSYHTMRNDIELLHKMELDYIILDESQYIKNSTSQSFKTVRTLKSKHKLTLTGTPIENSTLDLWSQMDFLNPGLLNTQKSYKTRFARPIEMQEDKDAAERLKKLIFPFLMRRTKEEVEKELPEKEIITIYSEMEQEQFEVYNTYREQYRREIASTLDDKGIKQSAMTIFSALLKLRQIALFPMLAEDSLKKVSSCKFESMKDMLEDILEEGHKVLIFSQFVKSLKIIEKHISSLGIKYSYIDGSIKDREAEIRKFQEQKEINIFLLSLKAGGVGINLTAADYVILFDPWWNPAVENQAIDRAHRIGQDHKVIAYKMIVKDTVEEKILKLQERKKKLVAEVVAEDNAFLKTLTKDDVIGLFS